VKVKLNTQAPSLNHRLIGFYMQTISELVFRTYWLLTSDETKKFGTKLMI